MRSVLSVSGELATTSSGGGEVWSLLLPSADVPRGTPLETPWNRKKALPGYVPSTEAASIGGYDVIIVTSLEYIW